MTGVDLSEKNDKPLLTPEELKKARAYHCWIIFGFVVLLIAFSIMMFVFQRPGLRDKSVWRFFHGIFMLASLFCYVGFAVFCVKRAILRCPFCNARLAADELLSSGDKCPKCKNVVCENSKPKDAPAASLLPSTRAELVRELKLWKRNMLLTSVVSTIFLALFIAAFCRSEHFVFSYKIGGWDIGFYAVFVFGVIMALGIQGILLRFTMRHRFGKIFCPHCKKSDAQFLTGVLADGACPYCETRVLPAETPQEPTAPLEPPSSANK